MAFDLVDKQSQKLVMWVYSPRPRLKMMAILQRGIRLHTGHQANSKKIARKYRFPRLSVAKQIQNHTCLISSLQISLTSCGSFLLYGSVIWITCCLYANGLNRRVMYTTYRCDFYSPNHAKGPGVILPVNEKHGIE